jgi:hypothetical protein
MEAETFPLNRSWTLWEMWDQSIGVSSSYGDKMKKVGSFSSLVSFWQYWHALPHADPRLIFTDYPQGTRRTYGDIKIDAVGVFQTGIEPAWEDPMNRQGCDISLKVRVNFDVLKEIWDRLVFGIIGETVPSSHKITGVRIVEKYKGLTKIELWLSCPQGDPATRMIKDYFSSELVAQRGDSVSIADHANKM